MCSNYNPVKYSAYKLLAGDSLVSLQYRFEVLGYMKGTVIADQGILTDKTKSQNDNMVRHRTKEEKVRKGVRKGGRFIE